MKKPMILVTAWHAGGARALLPVIQRLRKEGKVHVDAIAYDVAQNIWKDEPHTSLEVAYGSASRETAEQVLDEIKPDFVLTGTSGKDTKNPEANVWEKQIIAAANARNIPTIAVLDHWVNYWQRFSNTETGKRFCYLPTKIAVMDQLAINAMVKEGFPLERLVITGNPYHDTLLQAKKATDYAAVRKNLGLRTDHPVFCYLSSQVDPVYPKGTDKFLGYTDASVLDDSIDAIAELQPTQLLVKMHPAEEKNEPEKFDEQIKRAQKQGIRAVLFKQPDDRAYTNPEVFAAIDVGYTTVSSIVIDALIVGKQALAVQTGRLPRKPSYFEPFEEQGLIQCITRKEDLFPAFKEALYNPRCPAGFGIEGKGTERVTRLVYEMLGRQGF